MTDQAPALCQFRRFCDCDQVCQARIQEKLDSLPDVMVYLDGVFNEIVDEEQR